MFVHSKTRRPRMRIVNHCRRTAPNGAAAMSDRVFRASGRIGNIVVAGATAATELNAMGEKIRSLEAANQTLRTHASAMETRARLKDAHLKHVKCSYRNNIHADVKLLGNSLKRYDSFKEGVDSVFRLHKAAIIGTRKGDVILTGVQGQGSYGRVAKGFHTGFQMERVVVKEFLGFNDETNRLQYLGEIRNLKELCSEANDLSAVSNRFISHYVDRKEEHSSFFIMSAFAGNDISRLDSYQKRFLIGHIGSSTVKILEAVHKKGFVYRDLKPQNICLDENDVVRLIDFGAAIHMGPDTRCVTTNQTYNDYQHCSLNMHSAFGKEKKCTLTPLDDLWMTIFMMLEISDMLPKYWRDPKKREQIINDKRMLVFKTEEFLTVTTDKHAAVVKAICYLRGVKTSGDIDYGHLAGILSEM